MKKETNNKGFSLVELIVVIAIMAVLVGVLAPSLLRYVEKSRLQRDNSAIAEICEAMKIALAEEDVNSYLLTSCSGSTSYSATSCSFSFGSTKLEAEVAKTVGSEVKLTSNTYTKATTKPVIHVSVDEEGIVKIYVENYYSDTDTSGTANF